MEGIIVGCDQNQEWLLPWWWTHYSQHNNYPVAFVNFGMSSNASAWCQERGQYIDLYRDSVSLKEVSPEKRKYWQDYLGNGLETMRSAWFKKPNAFLHSPFDLSCWIDLDCEVKGPIDPVFHTLALGSEIALVREPVNILKDDRTVSLLPDEVTYNSGVVAFRRGADILHRWAEIVLTQNHEFIGDQDALSRAIYIHRPLLIELPSIYNWEKVLGPNPDALIIHYVGISKIEILKNLSFSLSPDPNILTNFLLNYSISIN
jgi:hypothetical protein